MTLVPAPTDPGFAALLTDSYLRVVGVPIDLGGRTAGEAARWLYEDAPFGLLVHDLSAEPLFVYANHTAQSLFEYDWNEFVGIPSRLSAEPVKQADRQQFMASVLENGYADDYRGLRVAKSGRRFWIEDATVWNVVDSTGVLRGQAALIRATSEA